MVFSADGVQTLLPPLGRFDLTHSSVATSLWEGCGLACLVSASAAR
jgi:hypothetical protein